MLCDPHRFEASGAMSPASRRLTHHCGAKTSTYRWLPELAFPRGVSGAIVCSLARPFGVVAPSRRRPWGLVAANAMFLTSMTVCSFHQTDEDPSSGSDADLPTSIKLDAFATPCCEQFRFSFLPAILLQTWDHR